MRVKLKSTHQYIFGNLALVRDTLFVGEEIIKLSDIDKLKIKKDGGAGALLRGSAVMLPAAALLFIFTGVANSIINKEPPLVTENNAKLSAGFALGGVLLWRLSYRVFKINKHHALKIVDVSIR